MRLSIATPVSDRPIPEAQLESWANKEARPVLSQARATANAIGTERSAPVLSAGTGVALTAWTSDALPENCTWNIEANVVGSASAGAPRAGYRIVGTFTSTSSVVAQLGATTVLHSAETDVACGAVFVVDAPNRVVTVQVTDNGALPMLWTVVARTNEGLSV